MAITVTKLANADQAVTETVAWATTSNAYSSSDADASATNAPGKSESDTRSWGFPAFTTADIPDNSKISTVVLRYRWKSSVTTSTAVLGIQGAITTATFGTEDTNNQNTTFQTSTKDITTGVVLSDLRTANRVRANVRSNRGNSNTALTWSLDYVQLEVTFNPPLPIPVTVVCQAAKRGSIF